MVELIVMDNDFTPQGVIDVYSSLIWERRFYENGYFELHAPATENNIKLLKQNNVLLKNGAEESGVIEYIETSSGEGGEEITAIGYFLSRLLYGHIVKKTYGFSGYAEELMHRLVQETVMNPESDDYIPQIKLGNLKGIKANVSFYSDYIDLHKALGMIAKLSGVGFILRAEPSGRELIFECFEGVDRSIQQTENPWVIFSEEYDTVLSSARYSADRTEEANAVVARYSGQYGEVTVLYNPYNKKGREKREVYVTGDCVTVNTINGTVIDEAATRAKLYSLARQNIKAAKSDFSAAVSFTGNVQYKKSYNLGDIVTCEWHGMPLNRRLIKITELYDANGTEIIPEMGEPFPNGE